MRILIFSNAYKPTVSGVVTSISLFRRGLIEAGHDVHIIAPEHETYQDEEPYIFRFPALDISDQVDLSLVIPSRAVMMPTVRGLKPDLIHSQHPIWMGDIAVNFARDLNLPLVFTFHSRYDVYAQKYVPIASKLAGLVTDEIIRRYLKKCAHVIAPTPGIRDFILSEYEVDVPVTVVPAPVDLSQYQDLKPQRIRASLGLEDVELLLYIGRLADEKNLDFLLRAFNRIAQERRQARLLLVGKGPQERGLKQEAQKMGLGERVIFVGPVPHAEIPHYAAAADLFVFTSVADTQGLVVIEAMAAGTPVVAVEALGPVDVLAEGGGLTVPPQEQVFAGSVLRLLADEPTRLSLGEEALRAAQRYTVRAVTTKLTSVYESAIAVGPRFVKKDFSETWQEIGDQLRTFGESLSTVFRTADEEEEEEVGRQYVKDVRARLFALIDELELMLSGEATDDLNRK